MSFLNAFSQWEKPDVELPCQPVPCVPRALAKSMALLETADHIFQESAKVVNEMHTSISHSIDDLDKLYLERVHREPLHDRKTDVYLLETLGADPERLDLDGLNELLDKRPSICKQIQEDYDETFVLRLPAILYVYFLVLKNKSEIKDRWPLMDKDLSPIFRHLGISFRSGS